MCVRNQHGGYQVRRLLTSADPVAIHRDPTLERGDPELGTRQQSRLIRLAVRTMALPLGRGALTLGRLS